MHSKIVYILIAIGTGLFLVVAPFLVYPTFLMKIFCFALFALAFNFLFAQTGLLSFGHAALFGGAAYLAGISVKYLSLGPIGAIFVATVGVAALGFLMAIISIRRSGIYFAMITLALAQIVYFLCNQATITGGEDGLQGIARGTAFGIIDLSHPTVMYYFSLCVTVICIGLLFRIIKSPYGQVLRGIRDNENRAISLGYNTALYKISAFVISAAFAGVAGALKALIFQFATLTDVHWFTSGEAVLMSLIGGVHTLIGPIVGAVFIESLFYFLNDMGSWVEVSIGFVFIVCVLAMRRGFIGELIYKLRKNQNELII